jgi:hypothetical protein
VNGRFTITCANDGLFDLQVNSFFSIDMELASA